ncbi:hypothetical protein Mlute_00676 [Meiothermus luteus]|jgi:hypothetical protein|uniref:Uncharacterized protein n=1 Tax=Meiothermus luteus TaxID=2026184 RepID=A0A399EX53_9DEIN|nr:hypothetical protein [Meiothermus luteus]RIH88260.1 hypothetical protein Mlute_00676 [Meiothermus luteus]
MKRYHWDIYAVLEAPQELYFGHEVEINVNRVETVTLEGPGGKVVKAYFSPTKRRGIERRTLLWAPHRDGKTLGEHLECGIPGTCARMEPEGDKPTCPICRVYGALRPGEKTVIGRLTHGGGVAIQTLEPQEKQRAMHPSDLVRSGKDQENPTPFRREYNQPGLYYPVYNHALSVSEEEFAAAAYAFLNALPRVGAGNPKGACVLSDEEFGPYLVLDRYLVPKGARPIISPHQTDIEEALASFRQEARRVRGVSFASGKAEDAYFARWVGEAALAELERMAEVFAKEHLV